MPPSQQSHDTPPVAMVYCPANEHAPMSEPAHCVDAGVKHAGLAAPAPVLEARASAAAATRTVRSVVRDMLLTMIDCGQLAHPLDGRVGMNSFFFERSRRVSMACHTMRGVEALQAALPVPMQGAAAARRPPTPRPWPAGAAVANVHIRKIHSKAMLDSFKGILVSHATPPSDTATA